VRASRPNRLYRIFQDFNLVPASLRQPACQQVLAIDAVLKTEVVLDILFPFGHGVRRMDHEGPAVAAPQIDCCG
jgi:hypothetical protein